MLGIILSFADMILCFVIIGFQVLLLRRQREIGRRIETLEERITELEIRDERF